MLKTGKVLLAIASSFSLVLSGCGFQANSGSNTKLSDKQVLRIAEEGGITTLDTVKANDAITFNVLNNVNEGLMRLGREKQPEYGIAYEYEISPDKTKYTFKLREDAKWSDGEPVTARDFEYAWKRVLNPQSDSGYAYVFFPIKNAKQYNQGQVDASAVGIKAVDDHTLEVQLEKPTLNFIQRTTMIAFMPQRKDVVEKFGDKYGTSAEETIYNGPFKVVSWTPQKVLLEKNENYWDKNGVKLETVEINVVKDLATGINLYNSGQIDTATLNQAFVDAFKNTEEYVEAERARNYYILFNHDDPFFKNEKIRKAINLAIDRGTIANDIMKGGSKPADALIPSSISGVGGKNFRELSGSYVKTDVARAQALFQEGLRELGMSEPPKDIVMVSYDATPLRDVAINIKEQLRKKLNLEIKLDSPTWKTHVNKVKNGNFDMAMLGWVADYNDPFNFFEIWESDNEMNFSHYKNPKFDQLMDQARQTSDPKAQFELLKQAEAVLSGVDDQGSAGFVPLIYYSKAFVQKSYVKDLYRHPFGPEYSLKWAYIVEKKEE
ncbi:peptide ABC transporter substrate-binding protein [Thermoactinomyces intermedius]|uniref:Peptide ABC transporter substrate-binding protein n=1 Tax=Thermoactinomyces intermedius TaxID=2024 RepID=A0A8I1DGD9_THEIN|nr:peptide ABC transporter substrate-binding protein [Thermoactinomyces intermedius]MBA4549228.1 peptide ABC transporter substrate-binding protein [Thermoactinomyces intermedius]MBA4836173.1 peptide ABC transporter substrate-binding protein [Thermoactinomyces intermedius]MBH8595756.1 peptide ABC transporter substrate-binding protein [Thermoactinomyces intermedius]